MKGDRGWPEKPSHTASIKWQGRRPLGSVLNALSRFGRGTGDSRFVPVPASGVEWAARILRARAATCFEAAPGEGRGRRGKTRQMEMECQEVKAGGAVWAAACVWPWCSPGGRAAEYTVDPALSSLSLSATGAARRSRRGGGHPDSRTPVPQVDLTGDTLRSWMARRRQVGGRSRPKAADSVGRERRITAVSFAAGSATGAAT